MHAKKIVCYSTLNQLWNCSTCGTAIGTAVDRNLVKMHVIKLQHIFWISEPQT